MKYLVLHSFVDKNTRELFNEGSLYICTNKERAEELIVKGYIKKQEVKARKSKKVSDE
ncbi:hypothetical protein [Lysinibacillus sp. FSL K6-4013]|uniref:hypothetical protein n=1 Tax=Lysinibacillus sp. FSL K6-4013 TaxID=2921504 RepID=UPI00315A75A6